MKGIDLFRNCGVDVRVNTVLMRSNIKDVILLVRELHSRQIPLFIRRLIPSGRADEFKSETLTSVDYKLIKEELSNLIEDPNNLTQGHYLNDKSIITRIPLPFTRHDCSVGQRGLVILPDGKVHTCGFLPALGETPVGDLTKQDILSVWRNLIQSQYVKNVRNGLSSYNQKTCGPCTNCIAISKSNQTNSH
jgi:radical SAM protein with 4Fe4S-binding SPASM domain